MQAIGRSGTNGQMNPEIEDASRIKIFQLRINLSSSGIEELGLLAEIRL